MPVNYAPLSCLIIGIDLSNRRQKKCSIWTVTHHPKPISYPLFNLWFSSLHLARLHTTHHVKDWNTQAESFKEDSQARKSTWCASGVRRVAKDRGGYAVCSVGLVISEPFKNSQERPRLCLWSSYACFSVFVLRLKVRRLHVEAEGPVWKHSEISHTAVWGVCVHTGGLLLCVNVWHRVSACDSLRWAYWCVCMCPSTCICIHEQFVCASHVCLNKWTLYYDDLYWGKWEGDFKAINNHAYSS